ncbi:hypothetical protein BASA83_003909 [Batrachochytrium salamandrivorans]|nr:hypothetical protein BASA83_003909 [Batrachochytrium salamandrivorans]
MMDLDATRRGPITPQERDRRFQGKLCFRCGKEGHFRAECPLGARRQVTPTESPENSIALFLADGQPASKSHVTHESQLLKVTCQDHIEITKFYVSSIKYPVILGLDWLRRHNPRINWDDLTIVFRGNEQQISDFPEELTIEYADVFSKSNANKLPAHSEFDFGIDLEPGFHPPHGKVYSLTPKETQVMATYVQEQLDKNFIRPSTSPAAAPCFFVAKKDGDLRPVQDYRGLNAGTIKKRYPLPLISDLLRDLSKGSIFTTLDLRSAYNLIRIKKGDEWKTAWICKQGLFEQQVMFGFANAPPPFQWVMNSIFSDMLGKFVLVYLDDIIIYSPDPTSHVTHVRKVLDRLREKQLYASSRNASMASISSTIWIHYLIRRGRDGSKEN